MEETRRPRRKKAETRREEFFFLLCPPRRRRHRRGEKRGREKKSGSRRRRPDPQSFFRLAAPPPPPPFPFPSPNSFSSPEREPAHCSALPLDPHLRQPISDLILSGSQIEAMCTPKPAAAAEATAAGDVERPPKTRLGVGPSGKESSSLGGGSSGVGSTSSLGSRLSSLWSDMFQDAPHEMVRRRQGLAVEEEDEL